jgi:hypothetical protein
VTRRAAAVRSAEARIIADVVVARGADSERLRARAPVADQPVHAIVVARSHAASVTGTDAVKGGNGDAHAVARAADEACGARHEPGGRGVRRCSATLARSRDGATVTAVALLVVTEETAAAGPEIVRFVGGPAADEDDGVAAGVTEHWRCDAVATLRKVVVPAGAARKAGVADQPAPARLVAAAPLCELLPGVARRAGVARRTGGARLGTTAKEDGPEEHEDEQRASSHGALLTCMRDPMDENIFRTFPRSRRSPRVTRSRDLQTEPHLSLLRDQQRVLQGVEIVDHGLHPRDERARARVPERREKSVDAAQAVGR